MLLNNTRKYLHVRIIYTIRITDFCGCLSFPPRSCTKAAVEEGVRKDFPLLSEVPYHDNLLIMRYKGKGQRTTGHVGPV